MTTSANIMHNVAILVTCYNRKELTLRLLSRLREATGELVDFSFSTFLVDDKSPDGTGDAVRSGFPEVTVMEGTGHLFWNRGMCLAYAAASVRGPWSHYLFINDDLDLNPVEFRRIFTLHLEANEHAPTVTAGAVRNAAGALSYSAFRRISKLRPLGMTRVPPGDEPKEVDTFNGNFVFFPGPVLDGLNGPDSRYHHAYGDIDLGLRARELGVGVILAPGYVGQTEHNPPIVPSQLGVGARLKRIFRSPKGVGQYAVFASRHAPIVFAPFYISAYVVRQLFRPTF